MTAIESAVVNNENITVDAGVTLRSTGGSVELRAGDRISLPNTSTVVSDTANVVLRSGFTDVDDDGQQTLDGAVTAANGNVSLDLGAEAGNATQAATGAIVTNGLQLLGTGSGSFVLDASTTNDVDTLAASVGGSIDFRDSVALAVGAVTVGAVTTTGITTTNDNVTLVAPSITLAQSVDVGTAPCDCWRRRERSARRGVLSSPGRSERGRPRRCR